MKMKKSRSLLMALAMSLVMSVPSFAVDYQSSDIDSAPIEPINIAETTLSNHSVLRTYVNPSNTLSADEETTNIKGVLLGLGMSEQAVERLSPETLKAYQESPQIQCVTSYLKTDENHNVTFVDKETALREATVANQNYNEMMQSISCEGNSRSTNSWEQPSTDSYMELIHTVAPLDNGEFLFSTEATWLKMPIFRDMDMIGSCAQMSTVLNSSRNGWYSYDITTYFLGNPTYDVEEHVFTSGEFENAINGNWYGSAATFRLPTDMNVDNTSVVNDNFHVYYEYSGHLIYPSMETWFNSSGCYDHSYLTISPSAGVEISPSGNSASIGLAVAGATESRVAEISDIHYVP